MEDDDVEQAWEELVEELEVEVVAVVMHRDGSMELDIGDLSDERAMILLTQAVEALGDIIDEDPGSGLM